MGVPYAEVIGDPIAHSKSPLIHKFWLEKVGIEGDYHATRVAVDELEAYFADRRCDPDWRGCNITMPHKEQVLLCLDTVTRNAAAIGAVNTIRRTENGRLHGRNSDVHGIWRSLDGLIQTGVRVVLIGAGGAARAAAHALRDYVPREVIVVNRTLERAEKLLADFHMPGRAAASLDIFEADLLINAAPNTGAPDLTSFGPDSVVFDMIYTPVETPLLRAARSRGLHTVDGLTMLIHQAGEAFATFFGRAHPPESHPELRELLTP